MAGNARHAIQLGIRIEKVVQTVQIKARRREVRPDHPGIRTLPMRQEHRSAGFQDSMVYPERPPRIADISGGFIQTIPANGRIHDPRMPGSRQCVQPSCNVKNTLSRTGQIRQGSRERGFR